MPDREAVTTAAHLDVIAREPYYRYLVSYKDGIPGYEYWTQIIVKIASSRLQTVPVPV
jgi:hypothetical protein